MEKLNRKLILKEITPVNFVTINDNIETIKKVYKGLCKDKVLNDYLFKKLGKLDDIDKVSQEITKKIKTTLDLKLCKDVNTLKK